MNMPAYMPNQVSPMRAGIEHVGGVAMTEGVGTDFIVLFGESAFGASEVHGGPRAGVGHGTATVVEGLLQGDAGAFPAASGRGEEPVRIAVPGPVPVLPKGLTRIRHYGYLGSAARKTRLHIRALLGELGEPAPKLPEPVPFTCDCCGGLLTFLREIKPIYQMRGPPPSHSPS